MAIVSAYPKEQRHVFQAEVLDDRPIGVLVRVGGKEMWLAKLFAAPTSAGWECPIWYAKAKGII